MCLLAMAINSTNCRLHVLLHACSGCGPQLYYADRMHIQCVQGMCSRHLTHEVNNRYYRHPLRRLHGNIIQRQWIIDKSLTWSDTLLKRFLCDRSLLYLWGETSMCSQKCDIDILHWVCKGWWASYDTASTSWRAVVFLATTSSLPFLQ